MGKPYTLELQQLADTYTAAMTLNIDRLVAAVASSASLPVLVTGSGGALSAAHFLSALHQRFAQKLAKAVTTLDFIESSPVTREVTVWCLSAGGKNSDIQTAFKTAVLREPQHLFVLCAKSGSPLSRLVARYNYADIFDFDLPSDKDGFLATNSLLAFFVVLARAYHQVFNTSNELPQNLAELIYDGKTANEYYSLLRVHCISLWERECVSLLYSISTQPAAIDLESKFVEAALGSLHLADYRNFAHGRHHWLAKRGKSTAVLALITQAEKELAEKTLQLLPSDIPTVQLYFAGNETVTAIKALVACLYIVSFAGEHRGIDPGRPGVPPFGQQLYNLRALSTPSVRFGKDTDMATFCMMRKTSTIPETLTSLGELDFWRQSYEQFIQKMQRVSFGAIVFDYDGTLCDGHDRFGSLSSKITKELSRLLRAGIVIGVATGRGKSVKEALRETIPKRYWQQILVGYYNGADCGLLDDDQCPNFSEKPCVELASLAQAFQIDVRLVKMAQITVRKKQITVEPKSFALLAVIWSLVQEIVHTTNSSNVIIVKSSHSIDVLALGVSKSTVVEQVRRMLGILGTGEVLCIGDRGMWPGNDFYLLREPFSLSVDEVSPDPKTCWNLAPPGYRGVQATLAYLDCLQISDHGMHFDLGQIASKKR